MPCIFYDININNDVKNKIKDSIANVASGNATHYALAATFFDEENNQEFRKFLFDRLFSQDKSKVNSPDELTNDKINQLDKRSIAKAIKEYLVETTKDTRIQKSKTNNDTLEGFTSFSAKREAQEYSAHVIKHKYYQLLYDNRNLKQSKEDIQKAIENPARAAHSAFTDIKLDFYKFILKLEDAPAELKNSIRKNFRSKDTEVLNKLKTDIANFVLNYKNSQEEYKEIQLKNFYNLYNKISSDPTAWLNEISLIPSLVNVISKLNKTYDEIAYEKDSTEEESDNNGMAEHEVDITTRSWDKSKTTFDQIVADDLKLYFETLYKSDVPYDKTNIGAMPHSSKSELGTKQYYSANYVIQQIVAGVNERNGFTSIEDFKNAIANMAATVKDLYGFGTLVAKMNNDSIFAHRVFSELKNPKLRKIQIRINANENGRSIDTLIANNEATPVQKLIYDIRNSVRNVIEKNFDLSDVTKLNLILYGNPKVSNRDAVNAKLASRIQDSKTKQAIDNKIYELLSKYIPDIKQSIVELYLNNPNTSVYNYNVIENVLKSLIQIGDNITKAKNDAIKIAKNKNANRDPQDLPYKPDFSKVNYNEINTETSIPILAKELIKFSSSNIRLTSFNAEGKMGSDLGDNNRISNIIEQINYIVEKDKNGNIEQVKQGLKDLANVIQKCPQYHYSPLFFGIPNSNKTGLFRWENGEVIVNDNAVDVIRFSLFDGINNQVDNIGSLYSDMTKGDYFMSIMHAYHKPVNTFDYLDGTTKQEINRDRAGYFLSTPADMPKNSIAQLNKYNTDDLFINEESIDENGQPIINSKININNEAFIALRQILTNELYTYIKALYNIGREQFGKELEGDSFVIKEGIENLYKFYHHNGKTLIQDGKLTGRVFKFEKLFNTNGFDVNEEMNKALSLYGEVIVSNSDGTLTINKPNWFIADELDLSIINPILDNIVSKWVNNFAIETENRSAEFNNINGEEFKPEQILDMALNYVTAYQVFGDIIEGDFKFYKDTKTFIKRAKENQAGGKAYGSYRLSDGLCNSIVDLECKDIYEELGIQHSSALKERNGWKSVTIANTEQSSAEYDNVLADLKSIISDENHALQVAERYKKGSKVNDAQSYITFEEWVRRMYANGTINQYRTLIEQIINAPIDENSETGYDISNIGKNTNAKIQIQKNYYFDLMFDEDRQCMYPRQLKNAEFVLIPQLLPKNSDLRKLYDIMTENNIDQINTEEASKAAQKKVLTFWDNNGKVNENFVNDIKQPRSIETYYYRNLYRQQLVPQHMVDKTNKLGIQIAKKIVDNLSTSNPEVKTAVNTYFDAYKEKVNIAFNNFIKTMNWKIVNNTICNKNDEPITIRDFEEFRKQGLKEAQRLGVDSNIIDYFTTDETGNSIMPTFMNNVSNKLESIAQSMFNHNITRMKLPGYHCAIISNLGYGRKLRFHKTLTREDETFIVSEVMVPHWFKNVLKTKLKKEGENSEYLNDKELLEKLAEYNLDIHSWYFMPTEGKQSIINAQIVDFLPEAYGSTAMGPDEIVAEAGKDFDGDTIYAITPNFYKVYNEDGSLKELKRYTIDEFKKGLDFKTQYNNFKNEIGEKVIDKNGKEKFIGPSYEEWYSKCLENIILDSIITIMSDKSSIEENLMGSQFDDIITSKNKFDTLRKDNDASKSVYNVFDEIGFRDNAMSGAQLKAHSVNRDTLNSVCNKAQAILNNNNIIVVNYNASEYNLEELQNRFGKEYVFQNGNIIRVYHNKYAWSNDNKNIDGFLTTCYSAETTAHILDAVKEGSIYNENKFTFSVFKTIVDVGSNYDTAIGFLATPGINRLVRIWNESNSMFASSKINPIDAAIKELFAENNYKINGKRINKFTNIDLIKKSFSNNNRILESINRLFGETPKDIFSFNYPLASYLFEARLNGEMNKTDAFVFDLCTILTFENINKTASAIETIAQCTNPDKFGAKQSLFLTRKVVDNVNKYSEDTPFNKAGRVLLVNGKPFLSELFGENSFYPSINEVYNNSTKQSININSILFDLEKDGFPEIISAFQKRLGRAFTDEEYNTYKRYLVSSSYRFSRLLSLPITINNDGFITIDTDRSKTYLDIENSEGVEREEYFRILGLKQTETDLKIKSLSRPTKEELEIYNKLTPAQKVIFIKENFSGNAGLFDILSAQTVNDYYKNTKGYSINRINYIDGIYSTDELIGLFNDAFNHKNPLIRLAAIDLVKYAFNVEGFNFKFGNISKIVSNASLLSFSDDGIHNIIDDIRGSLLLYTNPLGYMTEQFFDNFVRSHPNIIRGINLNSKDGEIFTKWTTKLIDKNLNIEDYKPALRTFYPSIDEDILTALGYENGKFPTYIKVSENKGTYTLYKAEIKTNEENEIVSISFYPLNNLESFEFNDVSINDTNNIYNKASFYKFIINNLNNTITQTEIDNIYEHTKINKHKYTNEDLINNKNALMQAANNNEGRIKAEYVNFIRKIVDVIENPNQNLIFYNGWNVNSKFNNIEGKVPVVQTIEYTKNGVTKKVNVSIQKIEFNKKSIEYKYVVYNVNENAGIETMLHQLDLSSLPVEEIPALNDAINNNNKYLNNFFRVKLLTDEKASNYYKSLKETQDEEVKEQSLSNTIDPDSIIDDSENGFTDVEKLAEAVINDITIKNRQDLTESKQIFKNRLNNLGVRTYSLSSIANNKVSIFKHAANYYRIAYDKLKNDLTEYNAEDGNVYDLGNPEFYQYLLTASNSEYNRAIKVLLDAKNFAKSLGNIDIIGEDDETNKYINEIKSYITKFHNLSQINNGFKNLFNIYYAQKYSNNPIIKQGIVKLNEAFGDITKMDAWLSDVTELNQKEVQIIAKNVYGIISEASQITAPEAVAKFKEDLKNLIGNEKFDYNSIIDKNGRFIQQYTQDFINKKQELSDKCARAILKGKTSREYVYAKLEQDEFLAKNVHRIAPPEYYLEDVKLRKEVLNNAGDLYFKYIELRAEYNDKSKQLGMTQDEANRRWEITNKINNLLSFENEDGTPKDGYIKEQIKALRKYLAADAANRQEFFKEDSIDGFDKNLRNYTEIIREYKKKYPNFSLDELMKFPEYNEARNWLFENTRFEINPDIQERLNDAFGQLQVSNSNKSKIIKTLEKVRNRRDIFGIINGNRFNADEREQIKKEILEKYHNEDNLRSDNILIKDIEQDDNVYTKEFYDLFGKDVNKEDLSKKREIITKINNLLKIGLDNNGKLILDKLFGENGLTKSQIAELGNLYKELRSIKGAMTRYQYNNLKSQVNFNINEERANAYNEYYDKYLSDKIDIDTWQSFIGEFHYDKSGNYIQDDGFNSMLFGFMSPKSDKYIDKEKTAASKYIKETLVTQPTEYYLRAREEHLGEEGWFDANHVYNPYTHKYEPLSIWTTQQINPTINNGYIYTPQGDNLYTNPKGINGDYDATGKSTNYNPSTGEFTNSEYNKLSDKQKRVLAFLQNTVNSYSLGAASEKFIRDGFAPARYKEKHDTKYVIENILGVAGLTFGNQKQSPFYDDIDYEHDRDNTFDMLSLLKVKGYKQHNELPQKPKNATDEEYENILSAWKEENKRIDEENVKLHGEVLDRNWENVFIDFIKKATDYEAKDKIKNTVYVLLEELKDNPAYKLNYKNRVSIGKRRIAEEENPNFTTQKNAYELVQNWARRILYSQYKEQSSAKKWANLLQNMTSAKYMILNVTGGIANIGTGLVNIKGETWAKYYFNNKEFMEAEALYSKNILSFIASAYDETSTNLYTAITKLFDVVDYDAFKEQRNKKDLEGYYERLNDALYSLQSGGEHYMQNSVLFAMLKSHRIYEDNGKLVCGSLADYTQMLEYEAMKEAINQLGTINEIDETKTLNELYNEYISQIKSDNNRKKVYDRFKEDINTGFIKYLGTNKTLINKYKEIRDKKLKEAEDKFNKFTTIESALTNMFDKNTGEFNFNENNDFSKEMFGLFRGKVISVNKKIHGVYDKNGAAMLERKWYGSLVMQYHKHIYPGFMKRFRGLFGGGMYNESRQSVEVGSYVSLGRFLSIEFKDIKEYKDNSEDIDVIKSIQNIFKAAINTVQNATTNWSIMPQWERQNIKRALGDIIGTLSTIVTAMLIYAFHDDDEIKDSNYLSTLLYLSDRLHSEAIMYSPWGIPSEFKTLYSSPLASINGPQDIVQTCGIIWQWMWNPDFDMNYKTGQYAGESKLKVKLRRNIPIVRTYDRLTHMANNNKYYRIGDTNYNTRIAKEVAEFINPDN